MKYKEQTNDETLDDSPKNVFDWLRAWILKQANCEELYVPSDYINLEEKS
jgi:hypothetical protein